MVKIMTINTRQSERIDKTVFCVESISSVDANDKIFWLSKTPYARLHALELMRQVIYGYNPISIRLQRVFAVTQRQQG